MTKEEFDAIAGRLSAANTKAVEVHYEIRAIRSMLRDQIENPPEWQPIDYSQAESGQAPFDGEEVIVDGIDGMGEPFRAIASWNQRRGGWVVWSVGRISNDLVTHWMPVPEFMKGTP